MPSIKIYSKEQVDSLISGLTPPTVVQTTGSSTTDVMSQNAVTTALGNKADTSALPTSSQLVPDTSGASQGDVLSFNGTTIDWAPVSGGSDWEYIDPTNLPNDFVAGDKLLIFASVGLGVSATGSDWNATILSVSLHSNTNIINSSTMIILQNSTIGTNRPLFIGQNTTQITNIIISTTDSVNNWNNSATNLTLLTIKGTAFNGNNMVSTSSSLTKSQIGTYIKAIYRFKPSA